MLDSRRHRCDEMEIFVEKVPFTTWRESCVAKVGDRYSGLAVLPSLVRIKALELAKDERYNIPIGTLKSSIH